MQMPPLPMENSEFYGFSEFWYSMEEVLGMGKRSFTNYVDNILAISDLLPPCVDIFYGMNVDKMWTF